MGYRQALLFRWSRRDRLAILIVALSVAFLVGTTLVVLAAGSQTAVIAEEFGASGHVTLHDSATAARSASSTDAIVLPYAAVSNASNTTTYVVGRPNQSVNATRYGLAGEGITVGQPSLTGRVTLVGASGRVSVQASHRSGESLLPPSWFLAPTGTVTELGTDGAVAISPPMTGISHGAPLRAALLFFLLGTRQALTALTVAGVGAGVLVGVTIFGVTRMGVRDKLDTIRVVRSTGATPGTVLGLFALRAGLLTAVGTAAGYAIGVILPNATVSVAIASGQTVSLPLAIDARAIRTLVPVLLAPPAIGTIAGGLAAYPAAFRSPGRIEGPQNPNANERGLRLPKLIQPSLLDRRLVVPTAATLAAFIMLATVAVGLGTALGPIATSDGETVVEPGAPHPLASQVPEAYADALVDRGTDASGEILLLEVVDGRPFIVVGAEFQPFAAVHGAALTAGRLPNDDTEAVIGSSLADAHDVTIGDQLLLGGSTYEGFTFVTVVGRFDASGVTASHLVVTLDTARHLAGVPAGMVHLVSADRLPPVSEAEPGAVGVVDIAVPDRIPANSTATVEVSLRNEGLQPATQRILSSSQSDSGKPKTKSAEAGEFGEEAAGNGSRSSQSHVVTAIGGEYRLTNTLSPLPTH